MVPETTHVSLMAHGVKVFFPFEPYDVQRAYIESVIKALNSGQNALLESPTGTGKTLSLLCSTLAWLQSRKDGHPMIYYTSRTHIQLEQAAREMKRSAYARVPGVVVGSRVQLCLNDEVRQQRSDAHINRACRNAITKNACAYYSNYESKLESLDVDGVNDIEDLCRFGKQHQCCPYYASRKIAESKASIVFMPYNYMLDTSLKKSFPIKLENSVIIFDEAHNIEGVLTDAASGDFTQQCLSAIQESCIRLPSSLSEALMREKHGLTRSGYDPASKRTAVVDEFKTTSNSKTKEKEPKPNPIEELAEHLSNDRLQRINVFVESLKTDIRRIEPNKPYSTDQLYESITHSGIKFDTSDSVKKTLDSMTSFWSIAGVMNPELVAKYVGACGNLYRVLDLLYPDNCMSLAGQEKHSKMLKEYYTVYLEGHYDPTTYVRNSKLLSWTVHLWCLYPAVGLHRVISSSTINGPRSIIVTSGTLAPMPPMERSLGIRFPIIESFGHVIGSKQLKIMVIGQSRNNYSLEAHHEATLKPSFSDELGKTIRPLIQTLPYGSLVFFSSYSLMNRMIKCWQDKKTIWNDMNRVSSIFIEGKDQESFMRDVRTYKSKIDSKGRAAFLGVCRGKLSEGLNLEGNYCRAVIMIGLPYPSVVDPRIEATRNFHNRNKIVYPDRGGHLWYSQQMTRALNQTIGRVIRSRNDFGVLVLCDPRFRNYKGCLSEWTHKYYPTQNTHPKDAFAEVSDFFESHAISFSDMPSQYSDSGMGAFEMDSVPRRLKGPPSSQLGAQQPPQPRPPPQQPKVPPPQRQAHLDALGNPTTLGAFISQNISRKRKSQTSAQRSSNKASDGANRFVAEKGNLMKKLKSRLCN